MINIRMQQQEVHKLSPKITVVGVGGAGNNAVNNMISSGLEGCEFLVCNTDAQALEGSLCENRLQMGVSVTGGLGAGAKPEIGRAAAEESLDEVMQYLEGANMAFITAGMGGGSGTGGAPIIAKHCREKGILTVGVVTKPFHFEGSLRMKMAEQGIEEMQSYVDTLIVIPNQNLFRVANEKTTFAEAFKMADGVLQSAVRGVTDLMVRPGLINLDFADIKSVMLEMGKAMMGTGEATGERRAIEAAEAAINNPLLDDISMKGARGVIINVTGGDDMTLFEVDEACNRIRDEVDPNANIIIGSTFDSALEGVMRVSVVATGIDAAEMTNKTRFTGGASVTAVSTASPATGGGNNGGLPIQEPKAERSETQVTAAAPTAPAAPTPVSETASADLLAKAAAPRQMPLPQSSSPSPAGESPALRGTLYKDSFIPPMPLMPYEEKQDEAAAVAQSGPSSLMAKREAEPSDNAVSAPASGLSLRPPVPGARMQQAAEERKTRTPSLFERFASPLRYHLGVDLGGHGSEERSGEAQGSATSGSTGGVGPLGLRSSAVPESAAPQGQGHLNIGAPSAPRGDLKSPAGNAEDELDIPAFLRRQAN